MDKLHKREEFKKILDDHFYTHYRLSKTVKPKKYKSKVAVMKGVADIFRTMQEMLSENNYGVYLKGFGVIIPKDTKMEVVSPNSIFKTQSYVLNKYRFYFEDEYMGSQFKTHVFTPRKNSQQDRVRRPNPHAIFLHRKKVRKN